jgi:hypothetical protein
MNGTEAASNYRKVRTTRISRAFDIHCLGTLQYMLTPHDNAKEYVKETAKRQYSNTWQTCVHTAIPTSAELRTQHWNDLDDTSLGRTERKLEQSKHLESRRLWMFCNAELAESLWRGL